ncbi:MAG: hypothetical protein SGILL_006325 [Bacillariaceae sp.]
MQELLDRLDALQFSPSNVETLAFGNSSAQVEHEDDARAEITFETRQFFKRCCHAVENGVLSPDRKHGKDLSRLMECVLYTYSCCASTDGTRQLSKESQKVLNTLRKTWNLDIQNAHYEYAIAVANHEQDFGMASRLFEEQIDPNAGNTVVPIAIDNPQGLFAVAKLEPAESKDNHSTSAAERVMDAVQRLIMVSPQDQSTYILAAGNALGYAGHWEDLVKYWKNNPQSKQYGTPLVAAVMQACWLCGRSREAWQVLQDSNLLVTHGVAFDGVSTTPGFGGEWQYAGDRDLMDPLLRDLAMRVIPDARIASSAVDEVSSERNLDESQATTNLTPLSGIALDLYHQALDERVTVSREALLGVVRACEQDERREGALSILSSIFDEEKEFMTRKEVDPWIVPGNELLIEETGSRRNAHSSNNLQHMGELLASVMRSCNSSSDFGIALFQLQTYDMLLSTTNESVEPSNNDISLDEQIGHLLTRIDHPRGVLTASMVALCGLRCYQQAIDLYNSDPENSANTAASTVHKYAVTAQARHGTLVLGNPWLSAQRHIGQLLQAVQTLAQDGNTSLLKDLGKMQHIGHTLGRAMNSCTSAHQPELSLHLLRWTSEIILQSQSLDNAELFGDSVTAETIMAHRWSHDEAGAVQLFEGVVQKHESDLSEWRLATAAGLGALVANGRGDDAFMIFKTLDDSALCTDSFTIIGKHLSKQKKWREMIDVYRAGSMKGFSTEELSLMAMKAVTSTKIENRLRILRAIADECADSLGTDAKTWMTSRYWHIKRELGFFHARLLMWWNDPDLALVDELNLAIKEFHSSNELRPKNDVVRAIVGGVNLLQLGGLKNLKGYERVPRTAEQWSSLLDELVEATRGSPIQFDPNFVDNVVRAYKSLGSNRECVDYIAELMGTEGARVRKSTLSDALEAARLEEAVELYQDIEKMLSQKKGSSSDRNSTKIE